MLGLWEDILGSSPQRPQDQIEISRGGGLLDADVAQAASASDSTHTARHQCEPQSLRSASLVRAVLPTVKALLMSSANMPRLPQAASIKAFVLETVYSGVSP